MNREQGLNSQGLTRAQQAHMNSLGTWEGRRYRYETSKANWGEHDSILPQAQWRAQAEQNLVNQRDGAVREAQARDGLSAHLERPIDNGNASGTVLERDGTRPDSHGRNANDETDLVHDHKHLGGENQVVCNSDQFSAQRGLVQAPGPGHVVTISSDRPNLNGNPPTPRPSGPLAESKSTIHYTDSNGNVTHTWTLDDDHVCSWVAIPHRTTR